MCQAKDANDREARILFLDVQIERFALMARYHIARATTGANTSRIVKQGDHYLTKDELIEDEFQMAKNHMNLMEEFAGERDKLIRQRPLE